MVTMKLTLAVLALMATTTLAAPAPQADWCYILSQDCDNGEEWCYIKTYDCPAVKREAAAAPQSGWCYILSDDCDNGEPWCYIKTYDCPGGKRDAEAVTEAFCYRPGGECFKAKRAADEGDDESEKANLALSDLARLIALSKKDPEAFYDALKLKDVDYGKYTTGTNQKREASEEEKRFFCYRPGTSCFKARRAAEAVLEAIEDDEGQDKDVVKRDAEAEAQRLNCTRIGQPCAKAQRDLDSWKSVARNILETLVE
jgi:hypothetical protein